MTSTMDHDTFAQSERERAASTLDRASAQIPELDPLGRQVVTDVLESLNVLHREGLVTIVRRLREDPRGKELLFELVDDPGVRMLLSMHGIIRPDPMTMAESVLAQVRPGLQSHGGDVELVDIQDSTVFVRLQGACNGCSMAAVTMREGVETAIKQAMPSITNVEVVPNEPAPTLITLGEIGGLSQAPDRDLSEQGWVRATGLGVVESGELTAITIQPPGGEAVEAIVVNVGGQLTAFVNACAHQGLPLDEAVVDESDGTITCPWHGFCYDASNGECTNQLGAQLPQLPLRVEGGTVWIRPSGAGSGVG